MWVKNMAAMWVNNIVVWQHCELTTLSAREIIRFNNSNIIEIPNFHSELKSAELKIE